MEASARGRQARRSAGRLTPTRHHHSANIARARAPSPAALVVCVLYCGAYGFGAEGPYGDDPAYDDLIQGLSGIADLAAHMVGEPRFFPTLIADKVCGLVLAYSLMAALLHRQRTGEGQQIEVPMFESMVQFVMIEHLGDRTFGDNESIGYARVMSQLRKPHRTQDGYVCALPYNDKNWRDFFIIVERPDLASDPRFITQNARSQNYEVLYALLGELIGTQTTAYWLEKLREANIPVAPVLKLSEIFEDPHVQQVGLIQSVEHPTKGMIRSIRSPVTFSASPTAMGKPAGVVGADTTDALRGLGLSDEQIESLIERKAAFQG